MATYASFYKIDRDVSSKNRVWFRFHLDIRAAVIIKIWNVAGDLIRTITTGTLEPGDYISRSNAVVWQCDNDAGNPVSGLHTAKLYVGADLQDTYHGNFTV